MEKMAIREIPALKKMAWQQIASLRYTLYGIFFFFMPFTQALTFNLGFPLKISELTLVILSLLYISFGKKLTLPRPVVHAVAMLFFLVTISLIVNLVWEYPYSLKEYPTRFGGYTGDSIMRYIYFILALCAFFISIDIFLTDTRKYIHIWLKGAIVAAIYSWYLMTFSLFKLPVFLLPGMEHPPQTINGYIIRCGTFLEGNYMGLYLLISAGMSLYIKRFKTGIFLLASIFTTFSTLSIIGVVILLAFYFRQLIFRKKLIPVFVVLLIGLVIAVPFIKQTQFYQTYIYEKLFSDVNNVNSNAAYSKADRLVTIKTALNVVADNPVLGVGLSNFGRHYEEYYAYSSIDKRLQLRLLRKNDKVIPNNIYIEILTEGGSLTLITFLAFVALLLFYTFRYNGSSTLFPTILCMLICFNAYPSFIMIYLWCFMALPVAHYIKQYSTEPKVHA